jgi:hypothetical protein
VNHASLHLPAIVINLGAAQGDGRPIVKVAGRIVISAVGNSVATAAIALRNSMPPVTFVTPATAKTASRILERRTVVSIKIIEVSEGGDDLVNRNIGSSRP